MSEDMISSDAISPKKVSRFFGQYIVKNRFQFKFSVMIFIFLAVACFTLWFQGHWAVGRMLKVGLVQGEDAILQLHLLNDLVAKTSILALAITFILSLIFSHYIAGPIYRFEKTLEEMRNGNLSVHIRLRKRDEFKETAELFNQTLASLRVKVQKERDGVEASVQKIKAFADKLKKSGKTQEANELEQLVFDVKNNPPQLKI